MKNKTPPVLAVLSAFWLTAACGDASPKDDEGDARSDAEDGDGDDQGDTLGDGDGDVAGDGDGDGGVAGDGDGDGDVAGDGDGDGDVVPGLVPVFVGQGHLGRTVVSCDDGRTWIFDQANDVGTGTCWSGENEIECDHDPGAGRGLTLGGGHIFAMFGWGTASTLRSSPDGFIWGSVIEPALDQRYGGVAYVDGVLLAAGGNSRTSMDLGVTWSEPVSVGMTSGNLRRAGLAGSHFVIVGEADDVVLSSDQGASWFAPTTLPAGCGASIQTEGGIAFGNGVILIVGGDGVACASSDGGVTFEKSNVGGAAQSHLVWSGADFVVYGNGNAYRSPDGVEWTATAMQPARNLGVVAVSDSGTFAAVEGGWGDSVWYEEQEFYRSEDGIHFETLPEGSFQGGHPMRTLAFGHLHASEACPGGD